MDATETWQREKQSFAGWEDEQRIPSWSEYATESDLLMPKTVVAIRRCDDWLRAAMRAGGEDDDGMIATIVEAKRIKDAAAHKLSAALDRVLLDAEIAPPPADRDLDEANRLIRRIDRWLVHTPHHDASRARARALRSKWARAIAMHRQEGLERYRKLCAEAEASWPAIERGLQFEEGFDPTDLDRWRGRTVKLGRAYNRVGWDFEGPFRFATRVRGVPVAGNFQRDVARAVDDAQRWTRRFLDEYTPWDVIARVEGQARIDQRNERRLNVKGSIARVTMETWDPAPCVTLSIVALHAGPVAVGPLRSSFE